MERYIVMFLLALIIGIFLTMLPRVVRHGMAQIDRVTGQRYNPDAKVTKSLMRWFTIRWIAMGVLAAIASSIQTGPLFGHW